MNPLIRSALLATVSTISAYAGMIVVATVHQQVKRVIQAQVAKTDKKKA